MENLYTETHNKTKIFFKNLKLFVFLTAGFIMATPLAAFLTEHVKKTVATTLHHETLFDPELLHSRYENTPLKNALQNIEASFPMNDEGFRKLPEWQALHALYNRNYTLIELSGRLFNGIISGIGLSIFLIRRRHSRTMGIIDYTAVLFGLFFMRDVIMDTLNMHFTYLLPEETILWNRIGISPFVALPLLSCLCVLLLTFVIYKIPKERLIFMGSGLLGIYIGLQIWLQYTKTIEPKVIPEIKEEDFSLRRKKSVQMTYTAFAEVSLKKSERPL
jgi:hypothetical protein